MFIRRILFYILSANLLTVVAALSQTVITGRLTDVETGHAIPDAIVKAIKADTTRAVLAYTITDTEGRYRLSLAEQQQPIELEFAVLGYRTVSRRVAAQSATIDQTLAPSAFKLKEVTVKAAPISSHGDTLNYNVASFIAPTDRTVEDILRKLPGITVKPGGGIEYQGKAINKFYIEGLDMLGGRYTLATRNIGADQITSVQVYENHQPVRLLKNIDFSENAALNIKLKNKGMTRPAGNVLGGIGYRPGMLYRAELFGFIAHTKGQMLATLKGDNCSAEAGYELTDHFGRGGENKADGLIPDLPFTVPGDVKTRTRRSSGASASLNTIRRTGSYSTLTFNLGYAEARRRYERESVSTYFVATDSAIIARESLSTDAADHDLTASVVYEKNAEQEFVSNTADFRFGFGEADTRLQLPAELRQRFTQRQAALNNRLSLMWRRGTNVYRLQSHIRGSVVPGNRLTVDGSNHARLVTQRVLGQSLYTNHSTSFVKGLNAYHNLWFDVTMETEHDRVDTDLDNRTMPLQARNLNGGYRLQPVVTPSYVFDRDRVRIKLDIPVRYVHIRYRDRQSAETFRYDRPYVGARINTRYTISPGFSVTAGAGITHTTGDMLSFLIHPVQHSYNKLSGGESGRLAYRRTSSLTAGYLFRNTMEGFFSTLNVAVGRTHHNILKGETVAPDGSITSRTTGTTNDADMVTGTFYIAKNFHDQNTTIALTSSYTQTSGERSRQGLRVQHVNRIMSLNPSLNVRAFDWMIVRIRGMFDRFTQTVRTGTINTESVIQSWGLDADLTLLPLRNVELFGQTNYRNHPSEDNRRTQRWLVDVGIRYQPSRVIELELKLQNLTDADTYTDIRYRDTDMFVTTFGLRPASGIVSLKYSF